MAEKKIIARINKRTGAVKISTEGYAGADCLKATEQIRKDLGIGDEAVEKTDDYYRSEQEVENTQETSS